MDKAHGQEHVPSSSISPPGTWGKNNSRAMSSNALSAKCNELANHGSSPYEPLHTSAETLERGAKLIWRRPHVMSQSSKHTETHATSS